jgi:hypothetical protein
MSKKQTVSLSNVQIKDSSIALDKLAGIVRDIVLGYRIVQNTKSLAGLVEAYDTAYRQVLIDNKAEADEGRFKVVDGFFVFESDEQKAVAVVALKDLNEIESDIEFYPLSLSRLASSGIDLDYSIIVPLQWMIVDDVE